MIARARAFVLCAAVVAGASAESARAETVVSADPPVIGQHGVTELVFEAPFAIRDEESVAATISEVSPRPNRRDRCVGPGLELRGDPGTRRSQGEVVRLRLNGLISGGRLCRGLLRGTVSMIDRDGSRPIGSFAFRVVKEPPCAVPGAATIRRRGGSRILRTGEGSFFACHTASDLPFEICQGTDCSRHRVSLAGRYVAYPTEEIGKEDTFYDISVLDLVAGRPLLSFEVYRYVSSIAVSRRGALAWIETEGTESRAHPVRAWVQTFEHGQIRTLARGNRIDRTFLRFRGARVRWIEGSRVRSAPVRARR